METVIRKVLDFMTFETPLKKVNISAHFANNTTTMQDGSYILSTSTVKQKLAALYWLSHVMTHYGVLFVCSLFFTVFFTEGVKPTDYLSVLSAGIIGFIILVIFLYSPSFYFTYLPSLQTVKEYYDQKRLENIEKCRRQQLSNLALCLVFYAFDKIYNLNKLQPNDQYAEALNKLYGVDQGSLKKNLELIFSNSTKRNSLSDRKKTEIKNRFAEAYNFFEELQFGKGINLLKQLEMKLTQGLTNSINT